MQRFKSVRSAQLLSMHAAALDRSSSLLSWWRIGAVFYVVVILALGTLPIAGTYSVFSHTTDEPAHIAAGMELLDRGAFTYEQQHPPRLEFDDHEDHQKSWNDTDDCAC